MTDGWTFDPSALERAAGLVRSAKALVLCAGAGMGVDSGLPDFRGTEGFWRAYPPFREAGLRFEDLANPRWFRDDPARAWGFYGHRLMLYRATVPHAGFSVLKRWSERVPEHFVFTSNVDGHFERAGFAADRVCECHGSIHWMQCTRACGVGLFAADAYSVDVGEHDFRAREPFPRCPACDALARPAILMFGDAEWDDARTHEQAAQLDAFEARIAALGAGSVVVIECGAGTAIPSVRRFAEETARRTGGALVRINVREPEAPRGLDAVSFAAGAKATLEAIDARL